MVKVLIVEDDTKKQKAIRTEIENWFSDDCSVDVCATFGKGTNNIYSNAYDLIVIDLMLPRRTGDEPVDISDEIIEHLEGSEKNKLTTVVAISKFGELVEARKSEFTKAAIFLLGFDDQDVWKSCLRVCMQRVAFSKAYDFVVVCALETERSAFEKVEREGFEYGSLFSREGLDCRELAIDGFEGVCVLQPRMGLVDAASITSKALSVFTPQIVCMSGICAGFESEAAIGTLLVSDICWDHQAGKWRGDKFEMRHYQEPVDQQSRTKVSQLIESDPRLLSLRKDLDRLPIPGANAAIIKPTVSGSAVIASREISKQIQGQHGKVGGLDMEVYGVHRAAALSSQPVKCFAAKTVVDLADENKSDDYQHEASILSARFVVEALAEILS